MPAVTGLVSSRVFRYLLSSPHTLTPFSDAVSETSFPTEYMMTLGWL